MYSGHGVCSQPANPLQEVAEANVAKNAAVAAAEVVVCGRSAGEGGAGRAGVVEQQARRLLRELDQGVLEVEVEVEVGKKSGDLNHDADAEERIEPSSSSSSAAAAAAAAAAAVRVTSSLPPSPARPKSATRPSASPASTSPSSATAAGVRGSTMLHPGFTPSSHVTRQTSHITRHTSHVTHHTSHVTRHTSHVTRQTSDVTRHTSHVFSSAPSHPRPRRASSHLSVQL